MGLSMQVFSLATHRWGTRILQLALENCLPEQTEFVIKEVHQNAEELIQDQFGNYVVQSVLGKVYRARLQTEVRSSDEKVTRFFGPVAVHGAQEDRSKLILCIKGKVLVLSRNKYATVVVGKCITHATRAERAKIIDEVCGFSEKYALKPG